MKQHTCDEHMNFINILLYYRHFSLHMVNVCVHSNLALVHTLHVYQTNTITYKQNKDFGVCDFFHRIFSLFYKMVHWCAVEI